MKTGLMCPPPPEEDGKVVIGTPEEVCCDVDGTEAEEELTTVVVVVAAAVDAAELAWANLGLMFSVLLVYIQTEQRRMETRTERLFD